MSNPLSEKDRVCVERYQNFSEMMCVKNMYKSYILMLKENVRQIFR